MMAVIISLSCGVWTNTMTVIMTTYLCGVYQHDGNHHITKMWSVDQHNESHHEHIFMWCALT